MKNLKGRRFTKKILIATLLCIGVGIIVTIILSFFGYRKNNKIRNNLSTEVQTEISSASEENLKKTNIETTIAVEYSNKMVAFYSPISCYIQFTLTVVEVGSSSSSKYGPIELVAGEKKVLSLDDLSSFKYSDDTQITDVSGIYTFVYGDSSFDSALYSTSNSNIEFKCYSDKIELNSNEDCFASFVVQTKDGNASGFIQANLLKLDANTIKTVTLDDLVPGFYSETAEIRSYSPLTICGYEKIN